MRQDAQNALDCTLPARLRRAGDRYQWLHRLLHDAADALETTTDK